MLQRVRFMRWLTRILLADDAEAAAVGLEARVGGTCACEKPEFAPENLRSCRRLVAEIARPCRRRRRAGRRGTFRTSRSRRSETSLCMKKVDRSFVGSELFEKRPVVRRGVGDGNQFGPHLADMSDLFGELRRRLAGFRPETERFLPSASWKLTVPQDARHASSSPSGRTPSSETEHGFAGFRLSGPWPPAPFPSGDRLSYKRAVRRRVHASQLSEEFGRFPRRAMVQDQESGGRVRQPIVDRRERVLARPEIPDRTSWVFCVRAARTLPSSRTGPPLSSRRTHHPAQRGDPLTRNRRTPRNPPVPSLAKVANALAVAPPSR